MYVSTKKEIDQALEIIGLAGFDGQRTEGKNAGDALRRLLRKKASASRLLTELKRRGLVHIDKVGQAYSFTITPAGVHRLQTVLISSLEIPRPLKWDGKWRLVAFDVPLSQSKERTYFSRHLRRMGLHMTQRSLWAHPYPCFEQVERLADHFNVKRYCKLLEVSRLDDLSTERLTRRFSSLL